MGHLMTTNSNDEWKLDDINYLETEMQKQYNFLSQHTLSASKHTPSMSMETLCDPNEKISELPSLFRPQSADKWPEENVKCQMKQMAKQMMHLAANSPTKYDIESEK